MQVDVCIQTRRSVRKYSDQDISGDTLREIVDLARFSPSWKNTQVVRYHVVKNADLKEKIAQNCVLGFDFNAKTIVRCNALVIVSVVTKVSGYEPDGKGVGSVILGVFDENKIRQYLTLPDNERVTNLIALGYPLEGAKNAPPRKEVSQLLEIVE